MTTPQNPHMRKRAKQALAVIQLEITKEGKMDQLEYNLEAALKKERSDLDKCTVTTFNYLDPELRSVRDIANYLCAKNEEGKTLHLFKFEGKYHLACTGFPKDTNYEIAFLGEDVQQ